MLSLPHTGSFGPPVVAGHERGQLEDAALNSRVCLAFDMSSGEDSESTISEISENQKKIIKQIINKSKFIMNSELMRDI